ncbi:MAG: class I SAM-dependent methyltransferase [Chloroflexi bacterium]|nr:class I SAM-dependent methyltransferase [Chloroflexota bacterium]
MAIFEEQAARYDAWYDRPEGRALFAEEVEALRPLFTGAPRPWLEVGVGSGRFAQALSIDLGVDPAAAPLALAASRGVTAVRARGEALPLAPASCGAVLLAITLCFVQNPVRVLAEARRVLQPGGCLVLGLVLAEGAWGQHYRRLGEQGDDFYRQAHFFTRSELLALLSTTHFEQRRWRSALLHPPSAVGEFRLPSREGDDPRAGFSAVLASPDCCTT